MDAGAAGAGVARGAVSWRRTGGAASEGARVTLERGAIGRLGDALTRPVAGRGGERRRLAAGAGAAGSGRVDRTLAGAAADARRPAGRSRRHGTAAGRIRAARGQRGARTLGAGKRAGAAGTTGGGPAAHPAHAVGADAVPACRASEAVRLERGARAGAADVSSRALSIGRTGGEAGGGAANVGRAGGSVGGRAGARSRAVRQRGVRPRGAGFGATGGGGGGVAAGALSIALTVESAGGRGDASVVRIRFRRRDRLAGPRASRNVAGGADPTARRRAADTVDAVAALAFRPREAQLAEAAVPAGAAAQVLPAAQSASVPQAALQVAPLHA